MENNMIFRGRNRVRYSYSRFGWTRGGGKTWHGGIDIEGLDSDVIRMPYYHDKNGKAKSISGTVIRARKVDNKADKTWEWGWYVTVQLDAAQTPDMVNFLIFAHCKSIIVKVGQKVKSGDVLAYMGNTGNAALANPPYAHVHFECRYAIGSAGLDPTAYCGFGNAVGTYGESNALQTVTIKAKDAGQVRQLTDLCDILSVPCNVVVPNVSAGDAKTLESRAKALGLEVQCV